MQKNELSYGQDAPLTPFFKRNPFLLERQETPMAYLEEPQTPIEPTYSDSEHQAALYNFDLPSYASKDHCDKHILLDAVLEALDSREIPFVKQIIVTEENQELREKALAILNGLSHQQYWYSEEEQAVLEIEKIRERSIFKPLFELGDRKSKFMLLDEMATLGGKKELIFLDTLSGILDPVLQKRISRTRTTMQERIHQISIQELLKHVPDKETDNTLIGAYGQLLDELSIKPYDPSSPMDKAANS
tara:strand:+ start:43716 stop:44453 length:738 start_codon:yes stop_codon:yes gene_type:complete